MKALLETVNGEDSNEIRIDVDEDIDKIMTFNGNPTYAEKQAFKTIANVAKVFAQIIRDNSPTCARQTIALQHVVDARMSANAAIATRGANFGR
jgi:hypothetical protein